MQTRKSSFSVSLIVTTIALLSHTATQAGPVSGDLFFTTFNGGANVNKVPFNYNGTTFSLGPIVNIAHTFGADGLVFAPDGDLLVGGQGDRVHKVNPGTGTYTTKTAGGVPAFHMAVDPSGSQAYASGIPSGQIATIPLSPFANGTAHTLSGNDTTLISIAFDSSGNAYYSANNGVGTIDLTTFTTTRRINTTAAHGLTFDPFSGDLIAMNGGSLTQIDPSTWTIEGTLSFAGQSFDQGTVDGQGHIFAASNTGFLTFVDYSGTGGDIDAGGAFTSTQFLASYLDDVAPLVGPGAPPTGVPDTGSTLALLSGAIGGLSLLRKKFAAR